MKRLVIEVEHNVGGPMRCRVQLQTHRGGDFAERRLFEASNGFALRSDSRPAIYSGENCMYVRGTDESGDGEILTIPSEEYLECLRVAVREYNEANSDGNTYRILA